MVTDRGASVMFKPTRIVAKTPRQHLMRAVEGEFAKFERKERLFSRVGKRERAAKLRLPVRFDVD